jgi:membrane protein DedA with SNARE-associated domain
VIDRLLEWLVGLPPALTYVVIGLVAALENVFPPVPADVIALFGGFLAGRGSVHPVAVFLAVWLCNVAGAMFVYWLGFRYGTGFFRGRFGRMILNPGQFATLGEFYARHGAKVIFVSRFLPMFRAMVPIFAGTSKLGWVRTLIPLAAASGLWYGGIVYLGATAGRNWDQIRKTVESSGRWLFIVAAVLLAGCAVWWWRSRRRRKA